MDDERLAKIEAEKAQMQAKNDSVYNELLQDNENLYNQQKDYANTWETTENSNLDKRLEFNTGLINQQKDKANQLYETEAKKAKNDFTAYANPYGLQAEQFASQGLLKSGVSETAKLGGYNSYQNRLAMANKVRQDALVQYDNDINQARLENDVQKAQNAVKKLEMNLQYANSYFNNKSSLKQNQLSNSLSIGGDYFNRYNTVYNNIQAEKEREEAIRQWNEQFAFQKEQAAQSQANWEKEYALSKAKAASSGGYSGSGGYALTNDNIPNNGGPTTYGNVTVDENGNVTVNEPKNNNILTQIGLGALNAVSTQQSKITNYNDALKSVGNIKGKSSKQDALKQMRQNGQINDDEFIKIAQKYGL